MLFTESAEVRMCPPIFRGIFKSKIPMNVLNTIHFNKISKNIYGHKNLKNLQKLQIDCLYFSHVFKQYKVKIAQLICQCIYIFHM